MSMRDLQKEQLKVLLKELFDSGDMRFELETFKHHGYDELYVTLLMDGKELTHSSTYL